MSEDLTKATALQKAKDEVWGLLEDWSARVPGKDEERAALCSIRCVERMTNKIHGLYAAALSDRAP